MPCTFSMLDADINMFLLAPCALSPNDGVSVPGRPGGIRPLDL